ncbi:MAG TPA: hypothetical protein DCE47_09935, partial [Planctomycetaceae bacterium]|nr:hypothetical protein [Planctomycetaceae bacterium]
MLRRGDINRGDACSVDRRNWTRLEDVEELFPKEVILDPPEPDDDGGSQEGGAISTEVVAEAGEWYYHHQGNENGPVTEDKIRELIASGVLSAFDSGWKEGLPDWQPLSELFEFPQTGMQQPGM